MENNLSKSIISKLKILGIYQIGGGIIGLGLTVWVISGLTITTFPLIFILLIAVVLYVYSIYCGILLLKKNISGLKHSLINQLLQIINFSIFGFTFQYISGVFISAGLDLTDSLFLMFNFGVSQWQITINGNKEILILNFNVVALFLVFFIEKLRKEISREQAERQITSIGQ